MNALADEGFVLFAGPLAGTEQGRVRVLLIVDAEQRSRDPPPPCRRPLDGDPEQLRTVSVEPWKILVGAERLTSAQTV